ncbi:hypothetical protein Tco_0375046 [Tanacetum coccineum]
MINSAKACGHDNAEDDGPPPGWDNKHQLKEETKQALEPAAVSAVSPDITVDHQDSKDEGPPPGWDSKSQPEPKLQVELPSTPPSGHMEADDVQNDAQNEDDLPPQLQAHTSQLYELVASDMQVEQYDLEDKDLYLDRILNVSLSQNHNWHIQ